MSQGAENVTEEMLQALASHYRGGSAPPPRTKQFHRSRFRVPYRIAEPVAVHIPGLEEDPFVIGTDGSSSDHDNVGGFAAVRGDGWALVGAFSGPVMNSHTCEIQGVRFALRMPSPGGRVLLRLDATSVIYEVNRLIDGADIRSGPIRDWDALNEICWHVNSRQVQVAMERIPDAEGGTDSHRIPSDPLMGTAHRLAWSARRLALEGIPLEGQALAWVQAVAASGVRWSRNLMALWREFERTRS